MSKNKCRICLEGELLSSIFVIHDSTLLSSKLMCLAKVQIYPNDGLPENICKRCIFSMEQCLEFIKLCEESDLKLRALYKVNKNETEDYCSNWDNSVDLASDQNEIKFLNKNDNFLDDISSVDVNKNDSTLNEQLSINIKNSDKINLVSVQENSLQNEKKTQKQQCFTCGKVMSSRFRLKTHLRTHTGERPYSCPHCNKNFSLAQNLKVHIRVHTGEKPLQCSICGESFAHSAGLAAHKRKHTGQMPYRCVLCPRTFRTVGHLQYHIRRHTGEKNFECDSCGRAFITRGDLKQHLLTHTGARPHVCCVCGMRLTRASHLKRHIQRAHDSQKPFACPRCPMKFIQKLDLEKHKKKHSVTTEKQH